MINFKCTIKNAQLKITENRKETVNVKNVIEPISIDQFQMHNFTLQITERKR